MSNLDFNQILDDLPEKPPRSRLYPYRDLIFEMRRRGRTFREIALVLGEKCGIWVVASTVYDFVNARSPQESESDDNVRQSKLSKVDTDSGTGSRGANSDEVDRRIAALKMRKAPVETAPERFRFVEGEPLRLSRPPKTTPSPD